MKLNKIKFLAFGLIILVALSGCAPSNPGLNARNRNLSTQTRIGNTGLNNGWDTTNNGMMNDFGWNTTNPSGTNTNNFDTTNMDNLNNGMTRPNTNMSTSMGNMSTNMGNMSTTANNIAKKISALPEVNSASVVLTNDTAIVGCNLRGTTQGTMTTALKQKIEKIVKDNTSNVTRVSVTSDPTLFTRIQNMSNGMRNGNMMNTFQNDVEDLFRRITPNTNMNR